jgi:hypothetical protein
VQEANSTTRLFESRAKAEAAASEPSRNRLYAFVLSDLLDRRKAVRSRQELEKLAKEFNIDMDKLESLAQFVNSPSIDKATIRPIAGKSEEDGFMAEVSFSSFYLWSHVADNTSPVAAGCLDRTSN